MGARSLEARVGTGLRAYHPTVEKHPEILTCLGLPGIRIVEVPTTNREFNTDQTTPTNL